MRVTAGDVGSYETASDLLKGLRWVASLKLNTPLAALQRHGTLFDGPSSEAPEYGTLAEGSWVPEIDFEGLGLTPPTDPETMWTPIGPVPIEGGKLLPFLKAFRRIVEGPGTAREKLHNVTRLLESDTSFEEIGRKFGDDFPESWFWGQLTQVPGIGEGLARKLFEQGFIGPSDLRDAPDRNLLDVPGVGPRTVRGIRSYFASDSG